MIIQDAPIDPLSAVLGATGFRAACSVRLTAGGEWALRFHPAALKFNAVVRGGCWLMTEEAEAVWLDPGDCFVVARRPFVLCSAPTVPAVDASVAFGSLMSAGSYGSGEDVSLLGGSVTFTHAAVGDFVDLLPPSLVIRAGSAPIDWLLDQLDQEWRDDRPGAQAACNDLLRLMFVHALRAHLSKADHQAPAWLTGLNDPPVAAALRAIHAEPSRCWRLAELAKIAGLSRASFAERFKSKVGRAPIDYATRWRMQLAARRLLDGNLSVSSVAEELGFLSDSAFGASFRRVHGVSPGRYRVAHNGKNALFSDHNAAEPQAAARAASRR